jgi:Protein of unknown function (DUF2281)
MSARELLKNEIEKLPESLLEEVFDFMKFLETKREKMLLVKADDACLDHIPPEPPGAQISPVVTRLIFTPQYVRQESRHIARKGR